MKKNPSPQRCWPAVSPSPEPDLRRCRAGRSVFAAQPHSWCPGQGLPFRGIEWNMGVCHTWYIVPFGQGNVRFAGTTMGVSCSADVPAPIFNAAATAAAPEPPHPFCTPRGGLFIVRPICDEIGVHISGCGSGKPGDDDRVAVGRGLT